MSIKSFFALTGSLELQKDKTPAKSRPKMVIARHQEQPGIKFASSSESARNSQKARAAALKVISLSCAEMLIFCNRLYWPGVSSRLQILDQQRGFFSHKTPLSKSKREREAR
jgi:hypothetical protein